MFWRGKLRHGARQSWVPWPRNMPGATITIPGLTCVGKDVGFGWGSAQGASIPLLGSPQCAVSGCRRLSCARRLARGGQSSALVILLGYLGIPDSVSCLVEDTFSYQVLLRSPQIPRLPDPPLSCCTGSVVARRSLGASPFLSAVP